MEVLNRFGKKIKQVGLGAMLVGVMSVSLVACGGDSATSAPPAAEATATTATTASTGGSGSENMAEASVKLTEWAVDVEQGDVPAGKVRFNVTNEGKFNHNYVIMDGSSEIGRTPNFGSADGPKVLEVDLKPGTYKILCDIMGHPEQGMMGELTVK